MLDRIRRVGEQVGHRVEQGLRGSVSVSRTFRLEGEASSERAEAMRQKIRRPLDDGLHRERRGREPLRTKEVLPGAEELFEARDLLRNQSELVGLANAHFSREQLEARLDAHQRMPHLVDQSGSEDVRLGRQLVRGHRRYTRWAAGAAAGSRTVNVAPRPGALSTSSLP